MPSQLYWRPPAESVCLGYALKWSLAERLWGHDGSLDGGWTEVDESFVPFLEGVAAAHGRAPAGSEAAEIRDEANELIRLIRQFGKVEISLS